MDTLQFPESYQESPKPPTDGNEVITSKVTSLAPETKEDKDTIEVNNQPTVRQVQVPFGDDKNTASTTSPENGEAAQLEGTNTPVPDSGVEHISRETLVSNFNVPLDELAEKLSVCPATLRKACRKHGIREWPFRKLRALEKEIASLEFDLNSRSLSEDERRKVIGKKNRAQREKRSLLEDCQSGKLPLTKKRHLVLSPDLKEVNEPKTKGKRSDEILSRLENLKPKAEQEKMKIARRLKEGVSKGREAPSWAINTTAAQYCRRFHSVYRYSPYSLFSSCRYSPPSSLFVEVDEDLIASVPDTHIIVPRPYVMGKDSWNQESTAFKDTANSGHRCSMETVLTSQQSSATHRADDSVNLGQKETPSQLLGVIVTQAPNTPSMYHPASMQAHNATNASNIQRDATKGFISSKATLVPVGVKS